MRTVGSSLWLLLLALPAGAQQVEDCPEPPPVTALVEPRDETGAILGEGAIGLALLHGEGQEGVSLLVLTLPPEDDQQAGASPTPPPPPRRCRIVVEGGLGWAVLDIAGLEVTEDPDVATLSATIPALRFIPESTELEELTLSLTFGVADDALVAVQGAE